MFPKLKNYVAEQNHHLANTAFKKAYPRHFCGDGMFLAGRNAHFLEDKKFAECMQKHALAEPFIGMAWRMHVLCWALEQALRVEGDILEFGIFRAFKINFLLDYFEEKLGSRRIAVFDTFSGIDPNQSAGSPNNRSEHCKVGLLDFVVHRLSPYKNVSIVEGAAPQSISKFNLEKIAFLHLDMNSWQAETGTLDQVWDYIVPGGVIVLDDFGLYDFRAQLEKELPWFQNKGLMPMELPTGQGIVIKHV